MTLARAYLRWLQAEALRFLIAGHDVPDELSLDIAEFTESES